MIVLNVFRREILFQRGEVTPRKSIRQDLDNKNANPRQIWPGTVGYLVNVG